MKKVFSVFILALVAVCASAQQEQVTIKFDADEDNRVFVRYTNSTQYPYVYDTVDLVKDELKELSFNKSSYGPYFSNTPSIETATEDAIIDSLVYCDVNDVRTGVDVNTYKRSSISPSFASITDGGYIHVCTNSYSKSRTDSVNVVIVGDREKVSLTRASTRVSTACAADTFAFYFDPTLTDEGLQIAGASQRPLAKVELNNAEVTAQNDYHSWALSSLVNGDTVRITTDRDLMVPITITLLDDADKECIDSLTVDGIKTDWDVQGFAVPWGAQVYIYYNIVGYEMYVNGAPYKQSSNYGRIGDSYGYVVADSYTQTIKARKYSTVSFNVVATNPSYITLNDGNGKSIALTNGTTPVEVFENATSLTFWANENCAIDSAYTIGAANDTTWHNAGWNGYSATAIDGATLYIFADTIIRDLQLVVYLDDPAKLGTFYISRSDGNYIINSGTAAKGYNVCEFYQGDNEFNLTAYGQGSNGLYAISHNGVDFTKGAGYIGYQSITFADGDVLKIYAAAAPDTCTVTVEQGEFTFGNLVRDIIVPVDGIEELGEVLQGTQLDFTTNAKYAVANGIAYEADEDGICHVIVNEAATTITLTDEEPATAISKAQVATDNNVYTLQGMLLIKNATQAQINALPAGLYIINGKTSYLLQK